MNKIDAAQERSHVRGSPPQTFILPPKQISFFSAFYTACYLAAKKRHIA